MTGVVRMDPAVKWATLRKIDAECWKQVGIGAQGFPVWELQPDWLRVMFKGAYTAIRAVAPPGLEPKQAISCARPDGLYEIRIYSRLRAGEYCDTIWDFSAASGALLSEDVGGIDRRRLEVPLIGEQGSTASVNVIWLLGTGRAGQPLAPQDFLIRYFCPALDETIDLNAATLDVGYVENAMEKHLKVLPWQRYLFWLGELRRIDKQAYGRIPKNIRKFVESAEGRACQSQMSEQQVGWLLQQGMLPPWIAWLSPQEIPQVMESIRTQQNVARRQDVLQQYATILQIPGFNPIPKLIQWVDTSLLNGVDLQVFMTIGALRELHGFSEVAQAELAKRRPELSMANLGPQGAKQVMADPEVMALQADPRMQAEAAEGQELLQRRSGNFGPTLGEQMLGMQVMTNIQQMQVGIMMMGSNLGMLATLGAADAYIKLALAQAPPWKLYKPYCC